MAALTGECVAGPRVRICARAIGPFARRVFADELQRAVGWVYRIRRDRIRLLTRDNNKTPARIDCKAGSKQGQVRISLLIVWAWAATKWPGASEYEPLSLRSSDDRLLRQLAAFRRMHRLLPPKPYHDFIARPTARPALSLCTAARGVTCQSSDIPVARATFVHFAISARMNAPSSSRVVGVTSTVFCT